MYMTITMPISDVRQRLTTLASEMKPGETVIVTQKGNPTMAILPYGLYDSLVETLAIMSDPEALKMLREGIKDIAEGRMQDWATVKDAL
jgi:prevent-host-death family protein